MTLDSDSPSRLLAVVASGFAIVTNKTSSAIAISNTTADGTHRRCGREGDGNRVGGRSPARGSLAGVAAVGSGIVRTVVVGLRSRCREVVRRDMPPVVGVHGCRNVRRVGVEARLGVPEGVSG